MYITHFDFQTHLAEQRRVI